MKKVKLHFLFIIFTVLSSTIIGKGFEVNKNYHGFLLKEKRFVKEVNAECLLFEHEKSGARLLKIANDDPNKTFMIAFKTNPESDCGTPHIMEHSVLNGSKKYPVKSPFDVLVKYSLKTFVNAFTGDHLTAYPVASKNLKDYFNLVDIYLDAVFNPRLYDDPYILKQEGWRYEINSPDEPMVYGGIVYNEMKGAYSSPTRELSYHVQKNLYPESNNRFSSGGYPPAIPNLTYEMFKDYHKKYYHPSNSYILVYGNADTDAELEMINNNFLKDYERSNFKGEFPLQKEFDKRKEVTAYYSVTADAEIKDQTFITLNYVTGLNTDQKLMMALNLLSDLLVNRESAPLRTALKEAGIGKDISASVDDLNQPYFQIRVQNANPEDVKKFEGIVDNTLRQVVEKGLDSKDVAATLNRMEFNLRETDDAQKGLSYGFQVLNGWFFGDDPFPGLEYEKPLNELKEGIKNGYLEKVVKDNLLDNKHSLLLALLPKPGLEAEINSAAAQELSDFKSKLSQEQIEYYIQETKALLEYQNKQDSPEAMATIPMLELKDVNPETEFYMVNEKNVNGNKVLHYNAFSNDIAYTNFYYDLRVLPQELLPYAALLTDLLASLDTENYNYGELDNELNMHTGGFFTGMAAYLENRNDDDFLPKFRITAKAVNEKLPELFRLTDEILNRSLYGEGRLKELITRTAARRDADFKQNGIQYALRRMESYYSKRGAFSELTAGYDYYKFITQLAENFDSQKDMIIDNLKKTGKLLFNRNNMIASVTGDEKIYSNFEKELASFLERQSSEESKLNEWVFDLEKKNEGILTASKVQYVLQGYDFKKLGYDWSGKMLVMNNIISREWLYTKIRVIGGAYGGSSGFDSNGRVFFYSYRDPNLKETFEAYNGVPKYLEDLELSEKEMTGFILGTIADTDAPLTIAQQGNAAVGNYFQKVTKEKAQKERDEILSTKLEDVKSYKKLISEILAQNNYAVYGNEDKIKENKELFGKFIQ